MTGWCSGCVGIGWRGVGAGILGIGIVCFRKDYIDSVVVP